MNTVKMLLIFHDVALRGRCTAHMNGPEVGRWSVIPSLVGRRSSIFY